MSQQYTRHHTREASQHLIKRIGKKMRCRLCSSSVCHCDHVSTFACHTIVLLGISSTLIHLPCFPVSPSNLTINDKLLASETWICAGAAATIASNPASSLLSI